MALEVVGGSFFSALFQTLFEKMASQEVLDFFRKGKLNEGLLKKLNIVLLSANAVLDDAEQKQLRNPFVRKWLHELQEATYQAEDLMYEISTKTLEAEVEAQSVTTTSKVMKLASTFLGTSAFEKSIEPKIEEILGRLKFVLEQKDVLGLKEGVKDRVSITLPSTSLVEESGVYGRNVDKDKIIKLLLSNDVSSEKISVIPIVGMGGIGKTTLAGLVYNDDRVKKHFDVRAWVIVSDDFNIFRITKLILDHVAKSQACDDIKDINRLQQELKEAINGKKFLFVLDDVWNKNYAQWDVLRSAFESGAHGSKIIVTTRDEKIASMLSNVPPHRLSIISDEDCWQLFSEHAFHYNATSLIDPNTEVICKKIVRKCKGLPIAVKSLAGLLRSVQKLEEWEKILESDIWELPDDQENILPALWLSYYYLPPHLKRCFAYCSLFPKDFEFQKEELILLWMAENLLPHQKRKKPEEVGEEYFDDLISRSFFQQCSVYGGRYFDRNYLFTMHDFMNDLAKFASGELCVRFDDNDSYYPISKARHLSYVKGNMYNVEKFESLYEAKSLHTFLALPRIDGKVYGRLRQRSPLNSYIPYEILQKTLLSTATSLRVLSLSEYPFMELPDSIGDLKHLRYLDLSASQLKRLPNTVCSLLNLQILLLSCCRSLFWLPNKVGSLVNLQHLDVRGTPLKDMPQDLCSLKNLQTLSDFVLGEDGGSKISQLRNLHHLHGRLSISGLQNIVDAGDFLGNALNNLEYLSELTLMWSGDTNDSEKERVILNKLIPHTNLKQLFIKGYRGTRFPDWLGDSLFSNITTICLIGCKNCFLLPPLGQLPSLKELKINGFDELVTIGEEFYSNGSSTSEPFRSLKTLHFENMSSWKEWFFTRANREGGGGGGGGVVFPSLTRIGLCKCEELVSLLSKVPQQTYTAFPSLQSIHISSCPKLESFLELGSFSNLEDITIFNCERLFALRMRWNIQRFTSLKSFTLWGSGDAVESFPEEGLLPTTLTYLDIGSIPNLTSLNGKSIQQLTFLERLFIRYCEKLECLPEEGLPSSLWNLDVSNCHLLSERCKREIGEDWPKIAHISEIRVDGMKI